MSYPNQQKNSQSSKSSQGSELSLSLSPDMLTNLSQVSNEALKFSKYVLDPKKSSQEQFGDDYPNLDAASQRPNTVEHCDSESSVPMESSVHMESSAYNNTPEDSQESDLEDQVNSESRKRKNNQRDTNSKFKIDKESYKNVHSNVDNRNVNVLSEQLNNVKILTTKSKGTSFQDVESNSSIEFFEKNDRYWNSNTQSKRSTGPLLQSLSDDLSQNMIQQVDKPRSNKKRTRDKSNNHSTENSSNEIIDKKTKRLKDNAVSAKKYRKKKKEEEKELDDSLNRIRSRYSDLQSELSQILSHKRSLITVIDGTGDRTLPEFCKSIIYRI